MKTPSARIETLDWLRGLAALSIVIYHLNGWLFSWPDAASFWGRLGIYGVSIFFILSGLSMAIVYSKYIDSLKKSIYFFVRRIFRIWPLMWVFTALVVLPGILHGGRIGWFGILANITTIFGFIKPDGGIDTIVWSIGNEMVFYALTPLIIIAFNKKMLFGNMIVGATFVMTCLFAFFFLTSAMPLTNIQWNVYILPLNNLFLYVAGIAMYYYLKDIRVNQTANSILFFASLGCMIFYPASGDLINIVTGINRLFFVVSSILLVTSFYKFELHDTIPRFVKNGLEQLGVATYGVYLLHPMVWVYIVPGLRYIGLTNSYVLFGMVVMLTIILALLSYNLFEKRLISVGKKLTSSRKVDTVAL